MTSGIYQIRNLVDNNIYIGSSKDLGARRRNHFSALNANRHRSTYLQNAFNKYGKDNFIFEILITCHPDMLIWYEQQFLDQWKPVYNTRKIADSNKGNKHTQEWKDNLSKTLLGNKRTLGYKHTEEALRKISEAGRGRVVSEFIRQKISKANKGRTLTEEHKAKVSRIGSKLTDLSDVSLLSGDGMIYSNIETNLVSFCKTHNLDISSMCKIINGKRKSHKGWTLCQQ